MAISHDQLFNALLELLPSEDHELLTTLQPFLKRKPLVLCKTVPKYTRTISLTGTNCALECSHCNAHYLETMYSLPSLQNENFSNIKSLLISGGCDLFGRVPVAEHINDILSTPPYIKLNLHVGMQNSENLLPFKERDVTISFDIVGDSETIEEVYGLKKSVLDIESYYIDLYKHFNTVPHLTLGLRGGKISGEPHVIEFLAAHQPETLTFLVFRPTPKTAYASKSPPDIHESIAIIAEASKKLSSNLYLGCMRPGGSYRLRFDVLAWAAGIRTMVIPHPKLVQTLSNHGIPIEERNECCALKPSSK